MFYSITTLKMSKHMVDTVPERGGIPHNVVMEPGVQGGSGGGPGGPNGGSGKARAAKWCLGSMRGPVGSGGPIGILNERKIYHNLSLI
jgi:hypothetical protein